MFKVLISLETWIRFPQGDESFCRAADILRVTVPVSALTRALLILLRSLNFFFLGFRQWRSRADRVLTLNMNIRLPLFWSTWSRAWGPDSATCAGLAHGSDYSDCRASRCLGAEIAKVHGLRFSLNRRKYLKNKGHARGYFNHHPPDCWVFDSVVLYSYYGKDNVQCPTLFTATFSNSGCVEH